MEETPKAQTPPNRKGVFMGGYVPPAMRLAVQRIADAEYYGNLTMAMMKLLDEALHAREQRRDRELRGGQFLEDSTMVRT